MAALVEGALKGMAAAKLRWTIVLGLTLSRAATRAGMWTSQLSPAQPPPAKQEAKAPAPEQAGPREERSARIDRYGDPLPEGTVVSTLVVLAVRVAGAVIDGAAAASLSYRKQRSIEKVFRELIQQGKRDRG